MALPSRILVADDQEDVREALRLLLKREGFEVQQAGSPAAVLAALEFHSFDVLLLDLNYARDTTSGQEGFALLAQLAAAAPELPVVVMTAWGTVESAVEAMRRGARDYVQKPWDNQRLLATLRTQVELGQALARCRRLEDESSRASGIPALICGSKAMLPVLRLIERVAPSDASVLVTGEHGTGKEVVARAIHAASARAPKAFVPINSGGLSEGVFESELFGHVKGAFTDAKADRAGCFEAADGGTLFLDEIGNMPAGQQAKLLRVLQTGELHRVGSSRTLRVDARILAATNADVAAEVSAGRFREDLLYRLNTVEIHLPPLRERREDLPLLAAHVLGRLAARYHRPSPELSQAALAALLEHPWPGNVRELEHVLERAVLLVTGARIEPEELGLKTRREPAGRLDGMTLDEAERHLIERALAKANGNVSEAAVALGVSRSALYRRLERHGLGGAGGGGGG